MRVKNETPSEDLRKDMEFVEKYIEEEAETIIAVVSEIARRRDIETHWALERAKAKLDAELSKKIKER